MRSACRTLKRAMTGRNGFVTTRRRLTGVVDRYVLTAGCEPEPDGAAGDAPPAAGCADDSRGAAAPVVWVGAAGEVDLVVDTVAVGTGAVGAVAVGAVAVGTFGAGRDGVETVGLGTGATVTVVGGGSGAGRVGVVSVGAGSVGAVTVGSPGRTGTSSANAAAARKPAARSAPTPQRMRTQI